MGLSNFPSPSDGGVLPVLVMNTVISVALFKNMIRSVLRLIGVTGVSPWNPDEEEGDCLDELRLPESARNRRKISITQFKYLIAGADSSLAAEAEACSVCLCGFEGEQEVSELSCKHFFHKGCLEKWFHNRRGVTSTCPLCRSVL